MVLPFVLALTLVVAIMSFLAIWILGFLALRTCVTLTWLQLARVIFRARLATLRTSREYATCFAMPVLDMTYCQICKLWPRLLASNARPIFARCGGFAWPA